jgi:hypothetical protein
MGRRHYCVQRTAFAEHRAFSPRVPVAITNDAASRIATVSATVTSVTGVFMFNRDWSPRATAPKI